jgi:hypothetical protein
MDGDALHFLFSDLDLAGMQATADFNIQWAYSFSNRASTTDRPRRPVESGKKAVSQRFDLAAPVTRKFAPYGGVMSPQQVAPALITNLFGVRG